MRLGERKLGVVSGPRSRSCQVTQLESDPQGTTPHPLHCIRLHCSAPQCTVETLGSSYLDAHPLLTTSRSTQNLFRRPALVSAAGDGDCEGTVGIPRTPPALPGGTPYMSTEPVSWHTTRKPPGFGSNLHLLFHSCPLS